MSFLGWFVHGFFQLLWSRISGGIEATRLTGPMNRRTLGADIALSETIGRAPSTRPSVRIAHRSLGPSVRPGRNTQVGRTGVGVGHWFGSPLLDHGAVGSDVLGGRRLALVNSRNRNAATIGVIDGPWRPCSCVDSWKSHKKVFAEANVRDGANQNHARSILIPLAGGPKRLPQVLAGFSASP